MLSNLVPQAVYILCALTAFACAVLLLRGYLRSKARILLWSSVCFVFLALNNVLLYLDLVVLPDVPLGPYRTLTSLLGMSVLVCGLILDSE